MNAFTSALASDPWAGRPMPNLDTEIGQVGVLDDETIRRARLAVCERAAGVAEARELLDMLGIGGASC